MAYQSIEEMKNVDPRTVDRSQLVDRESVRLDPDAGYEERLKSHIRQIRKLAASCCLKDEDIWEMFRIIGEEEST